MCIPWKTKPEKITAPGSPPQPVSHFGGTFLGVPCNPLPPNVTDDCACEKKKTKTVEPGRKSPPSQPPDLNTDTDGAKQKKPPPSQPPQPNSYSDGAKSKQSKKTIASDQKHASPDTTTAESPPPRSNSDSYVPSPKKSGALNQPPPPSPEKHKTGAKEPLQNTHHRNSTTYEVEGNTRNKDEFKHAPPSTGKQIMRPTESSANNTHGYENSNKTQQTTHENRWSSAPEEQNTKPRKPSSNDKKNRNSTGDEWASEEDITSLTIPSFQTSNSVF